MKITAKMTTGKSEAVEQSTYTVTDAGVAP